MRRWRDRYEEFGCRGLLDGRGGKPSPWVPSAVLERVLELYREKYFDLKVRHFRKSRSLEIPQTTRDSHFPTAPGAAG
jgi:hypothetical protein